MVFIQIFAIYKFINNIKIKFHLKIMTNRRTKNFLNEMKNEEIHELQDKELQKHVNYNYEFLIKFCQDFFTAACKIIKLIVKVCGIYLLWICLHYAASHLYIKLCVPNNVFGFLITPFLISTPHCQGLRWIVYNGANIINNMWLILGSWVYSIIFIITHDKPSETHTST